LRLRDSGWQAVKEFSYVYRLRSLSRSGEFHTGLTADLPGRLQTHNEGGVPHTRKFRPWEIDAAFAFRSREKAAAFEAYLKTGSGREFARRHF